MSALKILAGGALAFSELLLPFAAHSASLTTLYSFEDVNGQTPYGNTPYGKLVYHGGYLYGTTDGGGAKNKGTVFKFDVATGQLTTLYSFTGGADGGNPIASLVISKGTLYGTTQVGGDANDCGTVFKVNSTTGAETTLYQFKGYPDGCQANGPLLKIGAKLYGTTPVGGSSTSCTNQGTPIGCGAIFSVDSTTSAEKILWSFGNIHKGAQDGLNPAGGLTEVSNLLWGTMSGGTPNGGGGVFSFDLTKRVEKIVASFGTQTSPQAPYSTLIYTGGTGGALYGTTSEGGSGNEGTLFEVNPVTGVLTTVYTFSGDDGSVQSDISYKSGIIYGVSNGGSEGYGELFQIDLTSKTRTTLYTFTLGSEDGYLPNPVTPAGSLLYGTTQSGGSCSSNCGTGPFGTIFKVVP